MREMTINTHTHTLLPTHVYHHGPLSPVCVSYMVARHCCAVFFLQSSCGGFHEHIKKNSKKKNNKNKTKHPQRGAVRWRGGVFDGRGDGCGTTGAARVLFVR